VSSKIAEEDGHTVERRIEEVRRSGDVRLEEVTFVRHDSPRELVLACNASAEEEDVGRKK
jgi:hypothetical protein